MTDQIVSAQNLPQSVRDGIRNLLVCFPAGKPADPSDMVPLIASYVRMVDRFPLQSVLQALDALVAFNPRNPFPPTPADVYEYLRKTTGLNPQKPPMTKTEWLASETAQICGPRIAEQLWNEKFSPEAKARIAGGQNVTPLRLAAPDENQPS